MKQQQETRETPSVNVGLESCVPPPKQTKKQTKKQLALEMARFLLVGAAATALDYFVFWLLDGVCFARLPWQGRFAHVLYLLIATALGFGAGLFINWILSVRFVFRYAKKEDLARKKAFALFTLIAVTGLLATEAGVFLLVTVLPDVTLFGKAALLGTAWKKWIAKAVMTCVVLLWNYVGRKLFVFKG